MSRSALVLPALCLGLGLGLPAQSTITVSPVAVASTTAGLPTVFFGVPTNAAADYLQLTTSPTGIDAASLGVSHPSVGFGGSVRIDTSVFFLGATPGSRSAGTATANGPGGPAFSPVEFLVRFHAFPGTHGLLTLDAGSVVSPSAGTVTLVNQATIDVNADGTVEASSTSGIVILPWVAPPGGELLVKLIVDNHAAGTGFLYSTSRTQVTLALDPPAQCTITTYGNGCGGATASGNQQQTGSSRIVTLFGAGGFPNAPMVSIFGGQNVGPTLPGGCVLRNDALILVPLLSDALGNTTQSFGLPVSALGTLYQQFVSIDLATFAFRASNGVEIHCFP